MTSSTSLLRRYPAFRHGQLRATLLSLLTASVLILGDCAAARAAEQALAVTHIPADQFPTLKTKVFNSNFALDGASGNAVMRSRYSNDDGSDGEKIYIFGYQLDLTAAYGQNGVTAVTLDLAKAPAFAQSPKLPDGTQVYVVNDSGGDGGIDIAAAAIVDGKLTFTFTAPVRAGKTPGSGDHSLWFGLISTLKAAHGTVSLTTLGQGAPPPAAPSLAAGGKPADNQQPGSSAATDSAAGPGIDVFLPVGETPAE
ncbi:MAG TPA: hypothetical protein VND94_23155 [Terriglobia bacterium]|nr:hypothetical protein [Terriglobia bacterium]